MIKRSDRKSQCYKKVIKDPYSLGVIAELENEIHHYQAQLQDKQKENNKLLTWIVLITVYISFIIGMM